MDNLNKGLMTFAACAGEDTPVTAATNGAKHMHKLKRLDILGAILLMLLGAGASAQAQDQPPPQVQVQAERGAPDNPYTVEFSIGWDNSISGNINSSALGQLNNQVVVITKNRYEDVYGTGLQVKFGGGYMLDWRTEVKATFTIQSLQADLTPMGEFGASSLYGQYADYKAYTLEVAGRRYQDTLKPVKFYGEGTIGIGFIEETDVLLVAPAAGQYQRATDFYDQTAAFTFGINAGALFEITRRAGIFAQAGLRYTTGMSEVDDLVGTGLETINDNSARWTFPILIGGRFRF